jgi:xylulokinase
VPTAILPPAFPATTLAGRVTAAAALVTGLVPDTPVAVGGPDGSTGPWAWQRTRLASPSISPGPPMSCCTPPTRCPSTKGPGWVPNAYLLPRLWTLGDPTGLTGGGLDWLAVTMGYQLAAAAYQGTRVRPGRGGSRRPHDQDTLTGRRLPGWDAGQPGRMEGLSVEHGPVHLLRAAEEGSIFEVRPGIERPAPVGRRSAR